MRRAGALRSSVVGPGSVAEESKEAAFGDRGGRWIVWGANRTLSLLRDDRKSDISEAKGHSKGPSSRRPHSTWGRLLKFAN